MAVLGGVVVLACGPVPAELAAVPVQPCAERPGRAEVDPLLAHARRLVVVGSDADLAAVLVRLLRTERLDVELAFVAPHPTPATAAWGLGHGRTAARVALSGRARPAALARDAHGSVLVGESVLTGVDGADLHGEAYVDDERVFHGAVGRLVVRPHPDGVAATVRRPGLLRRSRTITGRALQVGSTGARVVRDGVAVERVAPRWSTYRNTEDWLLVR